VKYISVNGKYEEELWKKSIEKVILEASENKIPVAQNDRGKLLYIFIPHSAHLIYANLFRKFSSLPKKRP